MALRVVSLPATTSRMKKEATSGRGERFAVDVGVDQGGGDVVGRVRPPGLGQLGHQSGQLLAAVMKASRGSAPSGMYSGSP